jgi:hypothetical protein
MPQNELTTLLIKAFIKALTIALPWLFATFFKVGKNKNDEDG